jgi:hypothetical protein
MDKQLLQTEEIKEACNACDILLTGIAEYMESPEEKRAFLNARLAIENILSTKISVTWKKMEDAINEIHSQSKVTENADTM